MSLFGAMNTAITGLGGQAAALSNISDNLANSQTVGYKRVDTTFLDVLTSSSAARNDSGGVVARPDYMNGVQGTIAQSDDPLGLAIAGAGFFSVSHPAGTTADTPSFAPQPYYTRAGDFRLNSAGYIVNGAGEYLNGWPAGSNGEIDRSTLAPIRVSQTVYQPVATTNIALAANLPPGGTPDPANPANQLPAKTTIQSFDSQGNQHTLTLSFLSQGAGTNNWAMNVTDELGDAVGSASLNFSASGTLASVTQGANTQATAGAAATITLTNPNAASSTPQTITLALGTIGGASGLTQFAATSFTLRSATQDGVPPGSFAGLSTDGNGNVIANYDNGQRRTIAQVPVMTFADPDALQRQNGSSFTATRDSGAALAQQAGANGAGDLVISAVEQSNVDVATEFSGLIVAQQAYSANAKLVTTASEMMQVTLDMKR